MAVPPPPGELGTFVMASKFRRKITDHYIADGYECEDWNEQNSLLPKPGAACQCINCQNGYKDTSNSGRRDNARILQWLNNGYESLNADSCHNE